jgi:hypothetical protein
MERQTDRQTELVKCTESKKINKDRKGIETGWKTKRRSEKRKCKRSMGGTQNLR